ncbi:hypothetical protein CYLTODRAFT_427319 [Cylindrobasidium torrendii FP15055 ss-10]|uniref:Reelin domain-containing protein n=1 Tax=Cylindrobasidium torrendii FP15055 ss-10 TaxID=1314674 RepID=A0A0D7AVE2_9AGAR|nr:hypothetical protein CYLTODRAFT_427319 [Cylindrobasidium torrendii FP15055 ss-10]
MTTTSFQCDVPNGSWGVLLSPGIDATLNDTFDYTRVITSAVLTENASSDPSIITLSWRPDPGQPISQSVCRVRA